MLSNEELIKNVLSANIKSARQKTNLTRDELSEHSNTSTAFLKDIEGR